MKKTFLICVGTIMLVASAVAVLGIVRLNRYPVIRKGISMSKAKAKAKEEGYYIVGKQTDWSDGIYHYYLKGKEKIPVLFTGKKNPFEELNNIFNPAPEIWGHNKYLIKGNMEYELSEYRGVPVIKIEEWDIIIPILRSYPIANEGRIFPPKTYIDQYDLDRRSILCVDYQHVAVPQFEVDYLLDCFDDYYLISPCQEEGKTKWYLAENQDEFISISEDNQEVFLKGDNPEKYLSDVILSESAFNYDTHSADNIEYNRNYFIVKGELNKKTNEITVEKWDIAGEFDRFYHGADIIRPKTSPSDYYFEQFDIDAGIYFPDGDRKVD